MAEATVVLSKTFPHTGISDQNDVLFLLDKGKPQKIQDFRFLIFPGDVEAKVEPVDGGFLIGCCGTFLTF